MFKKDISPGSKSKVKSSVQRAIRSQICTAYPLLAPHIDEVLPKKEQLDVMKIPDRVTLYLLPATSTSPATPLFYQHMTDTLLPHLKLVHRFPSCFPTIQCDRGAIRFVLSGATLMAPGLTSAGGRLPSGTGKSAPPGQALTAEDVGDKERDMEAGEPVVIVAQGKEEACAVGLLSMGTKEAREKGKGPVVEEGHYLGDGLWKLEV